MPAELPSVDTADADRSSSVSIVTPPYQTTFAMQTEALFYWHTCVYTGGFAGIAMSARGCCLSTPLNDIAMLKELCSIHLALDCKLSGRGTVFLFYIWTGSRKMGQYK